LQHAVRRDAAGRQQELAGRNDHLLEQGIQFVPAGRHLVPEALDLAADERHAAQPGGRFGWQALLEIGAAQVNQLVGAAGHRGDQEKHRQQHDQHEEQGHQRRAQPFPPPQAGQEALGISRPGADPDDEGEQQGADEGQQHADAADDEQDDQRDLRQAAGVFFGEHHTLDNSLRAWRMPSEVPTSAGSCFIADAASLSL